MRNKLSNIRKRAGEEVGLDPTSENIELLDEGSNAFAESVDAGHRVDSRAQKIFVMCVGFAVLYALGLIVPKNLLNWELITSTAASVDHAYTFSWFVSDLQGNVESVIAVFRGDAGSVDVMVRYLVIAVAGAGLALSGAVYQGTFKNALVSPSTLGVMTGGSFGMTVWVVVVASTGETVSLSICSGADGSATWLDYLNSSYGLAATSFCGCFVVVGLVLLTMKLAGAQRLSGIMMIITGQVVGGVLGVVGTMTRYYYATTDPYGEVAQLLQELQIASFFREFGVVDIFALGIPLGLTFGVVMHLRQKMMLLSFDVTEQRSMGVDTRRMQIAVVGLCTLLTAVIISFCGSVGFVGFLVPHLARRLVGPNFKYLLPATMVLGAMFVLGAYLLVEITLGSDYVSMVGMYVSIFGAAVFLATALKGGDFAHGAFIR